MSGDFPESDWKVFRELHAVALERFCERVLAEVQEISARSGRSFHDRYLDVDRLLRKRDAELARAFDNPRRSAAFIQLFAIHSLGLLEPTELTRFSSAVRERIDALRDLHGSGAPRKP